MLIVVSASEHLHVWGRSRQQSACHVARPPHHCSTAALQHSRQGQCPAAMSGTCSHQHLQHGDGWSAAGCMLHVSGDVLSMFPLQCCSCWGPQGTRNRSRTRVLQSAQLRPANILQHSLRCPDTRDGDLSLIPSPKIFLPFTIKILHL